MNEQNADYGWLRTWVGSVRDKFNLAGRQVLRQENSDYWRGYNDALDDLGRRITAKENEQNDSSGGAS